jgi:hypothetical protein
LISTVVVPLTNVVVTGNVAVALPAGMVTVGDTLAAVLPLVRLTLVAAATAEVKLTVPWDDEPAGTVDGFSETALSAGPEGGAGVPGGFTVSTADSVTPAPDTEMVTSVGALTSAVEMLNPALVVPAGTVTKLLILATAGLLLAIDSDTAEVGAEARVTVANEPAVPVTVVGLSVSDWGGCWGVSVSNA